MDLTQIAAVIAALLAPVGAYLVAARQFSGKVRTSDAAQLWEESRKIRQWSVDRMREVEDTVGRLERRVRELEIQNGDLELLNKRLTRELAECQEV